MILSYRAWRRGGDAGALAPIVAGVAAAIAVGYGFILPAFNSTHSHRVLAQRIDRTLPADAKTVMFFRELDEGLWFYLRDRTLAPVPGSQPAYNKDIDLVDAFKNNTLIWDAPTRIARERQILVDWMKAADHASPYVLVRAKVYDLFQPGLDEWAEPVFREQGLGRNEVILLRVRESGKVAAKAAPETR